MKIIKITSYLLLFLLFFFGFAKERVVLAGGPVKIDDASNFGALPGDGRQVVRTSTGVLYTFLYSTGTGSCEVWKSTNGGTSWTKPATKGFCGLVGGVAIDSADKLHLLYVGEDFHRVYYDTYSTSTDAFLGEETIQVAANFGAEYYNAITVDSADKPHVAYGYYDTVTSDEYLRYGDRTSGSWVVHTIATGLPTNNESIEITIDKDNFPQVIGTKPTNTTINAYRATKNNPTTSTDWDSFTVASTIGAAGASLAVDSSGNSWVAWRAATTNYITLKKHNYGDAWSTWQADVTDSKTGTEPSLAINGSDVYVFYQSGIGATGNIIYEKYNGSWSGENTLQSGAYQDAKTKWSYLYNNQGNIQIDYLYSDNTDVYWASLVLSSFPSKVVFTNAARTLTAGGCNGDVSVLTIQLQDPDSAPANPSGTTVIRVSSTSPSYTIYSDNACTSTVTNGDFTFTTSENTKSVYIIDLITPSWTMSASKQSGPDTIADGTQAITVNAGALNNYLVTASTPQIAGTCFTGTNTITARDAWNNTRTQDASIVNMTTNGTSITFYTSAGCSGTTTQYTMTSGQATMYINTLKKQSGITVTATRNGGTETGTSSSITVNPGIANAILVKLPGQVFTDGTGISGTPDFPGFRRPNATAGTAFLIDLKAVDANNNLVDSGTNNYTGSKTISFSNSVAGSPPSPVFPSSPVAFTNGSANSLSVTYSYVATGRTVRADDTGTPVTGTASTTFSVGVSAVNLKLIRGGTKIQGGTKIGQ